MPVKLNKSFLTLVHPALELETGGLLLAPYGSGACKATHLGKHEEKKKIKN